MKNLVPQVTHKVLDDPFFQTALAYAKGLALRIGKAELSIPLILAGCSIANQKAMVASPPEVLKVADRIEAALVNSGIDLDLSAPPKEKAKLPLDGQLREVLKSSGSDLKTFIEGLLRSIEQSPLIDKETLKTTKAYACMIAGSLGNKEISPKVFSWAAYAAYRDGRFARLTALSAHFAANSRSYEALIDGRSFGVSPAPDNVDDDLPLSTELTKAMSGSQGGILAALNIGMKIGWDLLARQRTAYHEAGHAVIGSTLSPELAISKVSINEEGKALGVTSFDEGSPYWDRMRREDLLVRLCVCLAGRAAEYLKFGADQMDAGAISDIANATQLAWNGVAKFGLDPDFGPIDLKTITTLSGQSSGWLFDRAQERVQQIIKSAVKQTEDLLLSNWPQIEAVASALIEKGQLDFEEFTQSLA